MSRCEEREIFSFSIRARRILLNTSHYTDAWRLFFHSPFCPRRSCAAPFIASENFCHIFRPTLLDLIDEFSIVGRCDFRVRRGA